MSLASQLYAPTVPVNARSKSKHKPVVVYADELDFEKHVHLNPMYNNKNKGFKLVKVYTSPTNRSPLRIQFGNIPGKIPKNFGVDVNQHGKTYLTFSIPCDDEYNAMVRFQNSAKEYAKAHKGEWWSHSVSDNQVEDNFAGIVSVQKEKQDGGGFWPGNMKVHIPIDDSGDVENCTIVDEEDNPVSLGDLPGRKWASVMVEISGIYFQNRYNWGFGPKTLRLVKLDEDELGACLPDDMNYLDIALKMKRETPVIPENEAMDTDVPEVKQTKRKRKAPSPVEASNKMPKTPVG